MIKAILYPCLLLCFAISASAQNEKVKKKTVTQLPTLETTMNDTRQKLLAAQHKTKELFALVERRGLIVAGKAESELNAEIVKLAKDYFGMQEHWHKKIVRAGINTLQPYSANPPDRIIQEDDIVFLDFGPNVDGWETDLGRTYVVGNNPLKLKMKRDVEAAWQEANTWYAKQSSLTGAEFFNYVVALATRYGYEFGGDIVGHIIGHYPHEQPNPMDLSLDAHPDNHVSILSLDKQGNKRHWMLEIQFVDKKNGIGGFYEQLLE
jgi:Xaa-Pro aminopeptidase